MFPRGRMCLRTQLYVQSIEQERTACKIDVGILAVRMRISDLAHVNLLPYVPKSSLSVELVLIFSTTLTVIEFFKTDILYPTTVPLRIIHKTQN